MCIAKLDLFESGNSHVFRSHPARQPISLSIGSLAAQCNQSNKARCSTSSIHSADVIAYLNTNSHQHEHSAVKTKQAS